MNNLFNRLKKKFVASKNRKHWVFFTILIYTLIPWYSISTQTYELKTSLFEKGSSIKIVLISDLHSTIYGENQSRLIKKIKTQNPDLVLLTGDIFDDVVPDTGTQLLLSGIRDVAPIYYVTGNHEYWSLRIHEIRKILEDHGVTILSDNYIETEVNGNKIILAGIEDPDRASYEMFDYNQNDAIKRSFSKLDNIRLYKILMAHHPERIEDYRKYSFDLILSGHAHGGLVRIPLLLNGLYAPDQGFFPKYAGGQYQYGNVTHIISRGLSIDPALPRIFNPPELVVIIIKGRGA